MTMLFADTLKKLRTDKGMSQQDLTKKMYVDKSTVSRWESGHRLPGAAMIYKLADVLGVDVNVQLSAAAESGGRPNVIMVDDNKVIVSGGLPIIKELIPNAAVTGFTKPSDAVGYAKENPVALAFLDIEMGSTSGLDVCRELLEINGRTNVVYLTAFSDYALDAWDTGASGFMTKPLTPEGVREQLKKLRYPFITGGEDVC